jgi:hypothetical protein
MAEYHRNPLLKNLPMVPDVKQIEEQACEQAYCMKILDLVTIFFWQDIPALRDRQLMIIS